MGCMCSCVVVASLFCVLYTLLLLSDFMSTDGSTCFLLRCAKCMSTIQDSVLAFVVLKLSLHSKAVDESILHKTCSCFCEVERVSDVCDTHRQESNLKHLQK